MSLFLLLACNPIKSSESPDKKPTAKTPDPEETAKVLPTIFSLNIPSIDGNGRAFSVEGYTIQVKKTSGTCVFTDAALTAKIDSNSTPIAHTLKQKCDYKIQVSFGQLTNDGKSIVTDGVYLTNEGYEGHAENPLIVTQAEIDGKDSFTSNACFKVTTAGAKALGLVAGSCLSGSTTSVNKDPAVIINNSQCQPYAPVAGQKVGTLAYPVLPTIPSTLDKGLAERLLCSKASYDYSVDIWNSNISADYKRTRACSYRAIGFSRTNRASIYAFNNQLETPEIKALIDAYKAAKIPLDGIYGCPTN